MGRITEAECGALNSIIAGEMQPQSELPFLQIADTGLVSDTLFDILPPRLGLEGMKSPLIMKAAKFAEERLNGRFRKKNRWDGIQIPDVNHSYRVAIRLAEAGITDEPTITAALLHDVIEDSDTSEEELQAEFGLQIAKVVSLLSKNHNNRDKSVLSYCYYKRIREEEDEIVRRMAIRIKYADRTDNLACFVFMDLGSPIDRPEDPVQRGITVLEALNQNITETIDYLDDLDPENDRLPLRLLIAKSRAQDARIDFDQAMQ